MPSASPRYSPVGSKLSLKPNDCSQPTLSVPPALTGSAFVGVADAPSDRTAIIATKPATIASLLIVSSRFVSPSLPRAGPARGLQ